MKNISKQMSYLLRHNPENLTMDKEGYVLVKDLFNKLGISQIKLNLIVAENNKQRFSFSKDKLKIRANQGHSIISLKIKMTPVVDTSLILYHGTSIANFAKIKKSKWLKPMGRAYVHLSADLETATSVGLRHSKNKRDLIILKINASDLIKNNINIFISDNNVYQSNKIPFKYLKVNEL